MSKEKRKAHFIGKQKYEKKKEANEKLIINKLNTVMSLVRPYVTKTYVRESKRGTPHLVIMSGGVGFSVTYFLTTKTFRVFTPYPAFDQEQTKRNFKQPHHVADLFTLNPDRSQDLF